MMMQAPRLIRAMGWGRELLVREAPRPVRGQLLMRGADDNAQIGEYWSAIPFWGKEATARKAGELASLGMAKVLGVATGLLLAKTAHQALIAQSVPFEHVLLASTAALFTGIVYDNRCQYRHGVELALAEKPTPPFLLEIPSKNTN